MPSSTTVWAFDLGKASLGEAVREETIADLLVPIRPDRGIPRKSRRAKLSLRSSEEVNAFEPVYPLGG